MEKLIFALLMAATVSSAMAGESVISDIQIKQLCKLVDPTFLNQLPVLMEMKRAGKSKYEIIRTYMRVGGLSNVPYNDTLVDLYNSTATTASEAIVLIEENCFKEVNKIN